ncbi:response regulator transcription factor [Natronococcus wangiae]|uniref:response regulator transcription factor n=1 Tax=Natronococcus wangiae TaxID=3068275 RepID=UPI00273D0D03|nr:HalX domain-containing protein [Natronococcus sp. AD5]
MAADTASVLIVEDEPGLAELYASWLEDRCRVETARDGTEAVEAIDEAFDVILLDRRIPGRSGVAVLDAIRDRGLESRVAMVTAVEPDFDIVDMGFDDYLLKPVSKDELRNSIEQLLLRRTYDEQIQEFFALASKKAVLDSRKTEAELQSSQEYAELEDRLAVLRVQVDETRTELLERANYRQLYREIERGASHPE